MSRGARLVQAGKDYLSPWLQRGKPLARDGVAAALSVVGVTRPARFARSSLTVITFHRVLPDELLRKYPLPGLAVTPAQMSQIIGELKLHFDCLPLIDAYRQFCLKPQRVKPLLAITLDDGALDNYEYARPVLEGHGLRGSFYIPVQSVEERLSPWHDSLGFALLRAAQQVRDGAGGELSSLLEPFAVPLGTWATAPNDCAVQALCERAVEAAKLLSPDKRLASVGALRAALPDGDVPEWAGVMSWDQVRELSDSGHEIGSHTLTHPLLPDCDMTQIGREIRDSRDRLKAKTGSEVASFCYPNGSYDSRCIEQAQAAGYECSVTTRWGLNVRATPPHELRRCDMDFQRLENRAGLFSPERLRFRLSGWQPGLS